MILKPLIIVHRYVGVILGIIMTLWCLSGFVMMYQPYPDTISEEHQAGLAPLDLSHCCAATPLADDATAKSYRVEMLNGTAVLRTIGADGPRTYELATGAELVKLSEAAVKQAAETYAAGNGIAGKITELGTLAVDQWSVQGAKRWQPLWRAVFDDPAATWIYVNGKTGEIVQDVNGHERFWNWLGAIPHWLYPTVLRENVPLWTQVVIWSSAIGCFLVITGMIIGFSKLRGKSGAWWPYKRPMWMFHHVFGTFAGILVLTWTFSGLMTMSPWGLFESESAVSRDDLGGAMTWKDMRAAIEAVKTDETANLVAIRSAPQLGKPIAFAQQSDGGQIRFDPAGRAPFSHKELETGLAEKGGLLASGKLETLTTEDDYYYGHKQAVALPVYRVTLTDPEQTRVYVNAKTGELERLADGTSQRYRWLESGLHSLDFSFLRARPVWDIVTLILLAAVTLACATGAWLSFTRIGTDVSRMKEFFRRR
ncbi:MAG: PepSY domain-containing protein [Hyphomonadaceae bacterium]